MAAIDWSKDVGDANDIEIKFAEWLVAGGRHGCTRRFCTGIFTPHEMLRVLGDNNACTLK